jgi:phage baseplate assembly protein gpV
MIDGLIESAAQRQSRHEPRIHGVTIGQVQDNIDPLGLGRVQVMLPWMPNTMPWCRVSSPMAGLGRGTFFIPQIGDEVLVAFNHGDITDSYVIGSLWNTTDRPPATLPSDPLNKRLIRTPLGHELEFNDLLQTITITTITQQTITIAPLQINLATSGGTASITLGTDGSISISSALSISLDAPSISIKGEAVEISGVDVDLTADAVCDIAGAVVNIN